MISVEPQQIFSIDIGSADVRILILWNAKRAAVPLFNTLTDRKCDLQALVLINGKIHCALELRGAHKQLVTQTQANKQLLKCTVWLSRQVLIANQQQRSP